MSGQRLEVFGRQSSHYPRLVWIFAEELGVSYEFTPIFDLMSHDPGDYAGNPALKLPILKRNGEAIEMTIPPRSHAGLKLMFSTETYRVIAAVLPAWSKSTSAVSCGRHVTAISRASTTSSRAKVGFIEQTNRLGDIIES